MNKKWFRAKTYGWGWTPVTWQGWGILFFFVSIVVWNAFRLNEQQHSVSDFLINLIPQTIILIIILSALCYVTGEKPHWSWGKKINSCHAGLDPASQGFLVKQGMTY